MLNALNFSVFVRWITLQLLFWPSRGFCCSQFRKPVIVVKAGSNKHPRDCTGKYPHTGVGIFRRTRLLLCDWARAALGIFRRAADVSMPCGALTLTVSHALRWRPFGSRRVEKCRWGFSREEFGAGVLGWERNKSFSSCATGGYARAVISALIL